MAAYLRTLIRPVAMHAVLAREWWQSGMTYNPLSPRIYANPYAKYAELRLLTDRPQFKNNLVLRGLETLPVGVT